MWHSDVKKRVRQIHVHQNGLGNITKTRYQSTDRLKWHRNETRANKLSEILYCFVFFFFFFSLWRCMELICNFRCSCLQWLLSRIVLTSDRTYIGFVWNNMAFGTRHSKHQKHNWIVVTNPNVDALVVAILQKRKANNNNW